MQREGELVVSEYSNGVFSAPPKDPVVQAILELIAEVRALRADLNRLSQRVSSRRGVTG